MAAGPLLDRKALDAHGREKGWELKNGATTENEVTYSYDGLTGRLNAVNGGSLGTFGYTYTADSGSLIGSITGPEHEVTNAWESTRNALLSKENRVGSTVVSKYEYTVNALGQRSGVTQSGTALIGAPTWSGSVP